MTDRLVLPREPSEAARRAHFEAIRESGDLGAGLAAAYRVDGYRLEDVVRATVEWVRRGMSERYPQTTISDELNVLSAYAAAPTDLAVAVRARLNQERQEQGSVMTNVPGCGVDASGYPTTAALQAIREWTIRSPADCHALLRFVWPLWWVAGWGWRERLADNTLRYVLATGGWSGNEDLIRALQANEPFMRAAWVRSEPGGRHTFHVPEPEQADE